MLGLRDSALEHWTAVDPAEEDEATWSILSDGIMGVATTSGWHCDIYIDALSALLASCARRPTLLDLNRWLAPTGWRTEYVDGYVSVDSYFALLGRRCFPIARDIRRRRDLNHSAAPDFAHDVLGHLPMLFDPGYRELLSLWADRGCYSAAESEDVRVATALAALILEREREDRRPSEIDRRTDDLRSAHRAAFVRRSRRHRFETFFTWVFEFGLLVGATDGPMLIGGACLSSQGEMNRLFSGEVKILPFRAGAVGRPIDYTIYQSAMFIASGYAELADELERI